MKGKTYGTWEVKTEKRMNEFEFESLGIYNGEIDEIALFLANKSNNRLIFKRIEFDFSPTMYNVNISIDDEYYTFSEMEEMLKERPVCLKDSVLPNSFQLTSHISVECNKEKDDN